MIRNFSALKKIVEMKLHTCHLHRDDAVKILILLVLVLAVIFTFSLYLFPVNSSYTHKVVSIPKGANLTEISNLLAEKKIIDHPRAFILVTKLMFKGKSLRAGLYRLSEVQNYYHLIKNLSNTTINTVRIVIPEGYQSRNIASLLSTKIGLDSIEFMQKVNSPAYAKQLNISATNLEGYLFPDTYDFSNSETTDDIIFTLVDHFNQVVNDSIRRVTGATGRKLHEILTMASIIEGECKVDEERAIVASVYYNRLRRGMRLESDPTIQYIIPDGPRRLYEKHLLIVSPYNTYKYRGLPPGPVNNPGLKSIQAAISPSKTNYKYMVANGDGTHTFTSDYESFLEAKQKLQRIRRQISQKLEKENKR